MKSFNRRIDDLDDYLSPADIVLRELRNISRFRSHREYLAGLKDAPESDLPLIRMTRQARRSVEKSMRGEPTPRDAFDRPDKGAVDRRAKRAVRDVACLWNLYLNLNGRIYDELQAIRPLIILLAADMRSRLLGASRRFHLDRAWRRASRLPYPLDAQTAAAVETALENQVESLDDLRDAGTIDEWVHENLETEEYEDLDGAVARISRRVERELKGLVRSGEIKAGKVVSLQDSPHPFLSSAPLLDGRWIDIVTLELAELGVILADSGCTQRGSGDLHPLAWEEFVRTDAQGELSPIDDASWHDARQAATERVRSYRGRRRVFSGRDYVKFTLYQRWRTGTVGARLEASTENGFVVPSWNDWVKNQGPKAVLADIRVEQVKSLADAGTWTVHESHSTRRLQVERTILFAEFRSSAIGEDALTGASRPGDGGSIPSRDLAAYVLTLSDGLAAAVEGIQSKHFKNHKIVHTELVELLERFRVDLRGAIEMVESQRDWDKPLLASLDFPSLPDDRETAGEEHDESLLKQTQPRILQRGERIAKELVRDARFDALVSVGDKDAARRIIDEKLDEFLS